MNKLWLIIKREYMTRVTKKTFWLATLLTPLAFGLFIFVEFAILSYDGDSKKHILVADKDNILKKTLKDDDNLYFTFTNESLDDVKKVFNKEKYNGIIEIPKLTDYKATKLTMNYYSDDELAIETRSKIEKTIQTRLYDYKIESLGLNKDTIAALDVNVTIDPEPITANGKNGSTMGASIAAAVGMAMGFIMYMSVFIYGMMVMRSVMEEKTNRIIEVLMSSVKPFELMLGKIIGVGAVGLTQFLIWSILIPLISMGAGLVIGLKGGHPKQMQMPNGTPQISEAEVQTMTQQFLNELGNINWWWIVPLFALYFLCGYILYASMFAAVGSAIGDDVGEGQSLTIPITIPVVLAILIMTNAVRQPDTSMAMFGSLFPLFSPIVMPALLVFKPPVWQVVLSLTLLIGTSIFFTWLSGRIYRVGILLYGKKASFKEMVKWVFTRD
jgi:ABC-2 type transport system permease protein